MVVDPEAVVILILTPGSGTRSVHFDRVNARTRIGGFPCGAREVEEGRLKRRCERVPGADRVAGRPARLLKGGFV